MDVRFVHRALYLKVHHLHCKSMFSPGEQAERAETLSCARVLEPQRRGNQPMISELQAVTLVPGLEPNARNAGEKRLAAGGCLQACTGRTE